MTAQPSARACPAPTRIASLDLVRGIAVLGILAINIAGFAGPAIATETPWLPGAARPADEWAFALGFLLFEGKMRALFSLLFGASMLLFVERAEEARRDGEALQLRRLGWLALFGWLHYILFWWGDILFVYAGSGVIALALRRLPDRALLVLALAIFAGWHGWGMWDSLPVFRADAAMRLGIASAAERAAQAASLKLLLGHMHQEMAQARLGFLAQIAAKLSTDPTWSITMLIYTMGETLPLMLLGMVMLRRGFFAGAWPRRTLVGMAASGLMLGGALTGAMLDWVWARHFPPLLMPYILAYWAAPAHLVMALGYAALIMLAAPRLLSGWLGRRLCAAGRAAFSNYLGTTMLMTALFYGWGLGLYGKVPPAEQPLFVLGGWVAMLGWSQPWLAHFRQGPLEWLWRSLTEGRAMPMRR